MRRLHIALASAGLALIAARATAAPPASEATVQAHVDAATRDAGTDLTALVGLCKPAPTTRPSGPEVEKGLAALIAKPAPPPTKAFDNLYFVGATWVSAWALDTPDGIILFDALNNHDEAATLIEGGLRKLGLDPARIKYIVVTHGHGDHYGGAQYLVDKFGAHVVMSNADWTMMETKLEFESKLWDAPPKRDIGVVDGESITLGGSTASLYLTPGHTMGTLSPVFDVTANGEKHRVVLWGGTGFNFGKDFGRLDSYIASTARMRSLAATQGIDVMISNHSAIDGSLAKLERLRQQPGLKPNPFVMGVPTVERALTVMNECARATRDRFSLHD